LVGKCSVVKPADGLTRKLNNLKINQYWI